MERRKENVMRDTPTCQNGDDDATPIPAERSENGHIPAMFDHGSDNDPARPGSPARGHYPPGHDVDVDSNIVLSVN
jgi:hypothetical protein